MGSTFAYVIRQRGTIRAISVIGPWLHRLRRTGGDIDHDTGALPGCGFLDGCCPLGPSSGGPNYGKLKMAEHVPWCRVTPFEGDSCTGLTGPPGGPSQDLARTSGQGAERAPGIPFHFDAGARIQGERRQTRFPFSVRSVGSAASRGGASRTRVAAPRPHAEDPPRNIYPTPRS